MEAEAPQCLFDAGAAFRRAQIAGGELDLDIMGLRQLARGLGELCLVAGNEKERMTAPGELFRERTPDPLRCPGDDDGGREGLRLLVGVVHLHTGHLGGQVSGGKAWDGQAPAR